MAVTILPQYCIDSIQQISTYHTDFINHQQIQATYNVDLLFSEFMKSLCRHKFRIRHIRCKRKLEERVYCHSTGIDSSNPGRCYNYHTFWRFCFQLSEKSSLSGSGLSGKKQVGTSIFYKLPGKLYFEIGFHVYSFSVKDTEIYSTPAPTVRKY